MTCRMLNTVVKCCQIMYFIQAITFLYDVCSAICHTCIQYIIVNYNNIDCRNRRLLAVARCVAACTRVCGCINMIQLRMHQTALLFFFFWGVGYARDPPRTIMNPHEYSYSPGCNSCFCPST